MVSHAGQLKYTRCEHWNPVWLLTNTQFLHIRGRKNTRFHKSHLALILIFPAVLHALLMPNLWFMVLYCYLCALRWFLLSFTTICKLFKCYLTRQSRKANLRLHRVMQGPQLSTGGQQNFCDMMMTVCLRWYTPYHHFVYSLFCFAFFY